MDELISKQAAIEAINLWLYCDKDERMPADVIKALPTVQLGMSLVEVGTYVPDMNAGDMISRRDATTIPVMPKEHRHYQTYNLDDAYEQGWYDLQGCIENLPPVQPTITHEQAIDYLHKTGWLQNHDRILTESKMMMPVQPIIYCEKCLYKKICSWKNQGAEFCSFGVRGKQDDSD